MLFFIKTIIFIFGLSVGSFINCLIYRMEQEKSIKGRSYCPKCKHTLSFLDLFPVLSFIFLKGKCRYCRNKISFQYPLVEILTGIIFLSIYNYLFSLYDGVYIMHEFVFLSILSSVLILIFIYDLKHLLIPDIATYLTIFLAIIYSFLKGNILINLFSGITCFLLFLSIFLITRGRGMGFGDVKLSFFVGVFSGYPGFIVSLFTSFLIGAIIGISLITLRIKGMKSEIPFGPFMIIGTIISFFYGEIIIDYYFGLFL